MISAKVIAHSVTPNGIPIITIEYAAPRFILAEFNTHRVFSRNAGSSRAIPTTKIIEAVVNTPVIPVWNRNKPGMQGVFDVTDEEIAAWQEVWLEARNDAVKHAQRLFDLKCHKQIVNRVLEPYMYYKGLVTSTEWENWFNLRDHEAAQPEIALVARAFKEAIDKSTPVTLYPGQWHLPYILGDEFSLLVSDQLKVSAARCARLSYRTFDDNKISTVEKDTKLFDDLFAEGHMSPFEHQATPDDDFEYPHEHGNFTGWRQFRKQIEKDN